LWTLGRKRELNPRFWSTSTRSPGLEEQQLQARSTSERISGCAHPSGRHRGVRSSASRMVRELGPDQQRAGDAHRAVRPLAVQSAHDDRVAQGNLSLHLDLD